MSPQNKPQKIDRQRTKPRKIVVTSPVTKFLIGMLATASAILLPRLIPMAFAVSGNQGLSMRWEWGWVLASIVVCAIVGAVVALKEWGVASHPGETFMFALGVPAILAGMFNVYNGDQNLMAQKVKQDAIIEKLGDSEGIQIHPAQPGPTSRRESTAPGLDIASLGRLLIVPVYAASIGSDEPQFASQIVESKYWVVLERDPTEQGANGKRDVLRKRLAARPPGKPEIKIEVVRFGKEFLVVEAGGPRVRSEAMLSAVSLKRDYVLPVGLQEVPK